MDRDQFLAGVDLEIRTLSISLCELVLRLVPDAQEQVYPGWGNIQYGCGAGMKMRFCAIEPGRGYVNLYFQRGADLPDPLHLLVGTGKKMRHVKLRPADPLPIDGIEALMRAAVSILSL
ncbi:MAG TPA: DUF1801 domain-containing protein [Anaerolineaceae bacterium]|jgi:hypothetical protein